MSAAVPVSNNLEVLTAAARKVIERGWYLINCEPYTKNAFYSWNELATNTEYSLKRWADKQESANPAVYLKKSNLTVLDIDAGLTDDANALRFAKEILGSETMIVKSGKQGYHFYFIGTRDLPDCKYRNGVLSGDLKHNGFVLAEGAFHGETGRAYLCINPGISIAPLPKVLAKYTAEKKNKSVDAPASTSAVERTPYAYTEPTVMTRKVWKGGRYEFLRDRAYYLRVRDGGSIEGITAMLKDICIRYCEDGETYAQQDNKLRGIAEYAMKYAVSPLYEPRGPKPEPPLWDVLRKELQVNQAVLYSDLVNRESLVDIPTCSLYRARKPLCITSYRLGNDVFWIREQLATEGLPGTVLGKSNTITLNTYQNEKRMVDQTVVDIPRLSRGRNKEYLRKAKQKSRAKAKAKQTQGGAQ